MRRTKTLPDLQRQLTGLATATEDDRRRKLKVRLDRFIGDKPALDNLLSQEPIFSKYEVGKENVIWLDDRIRNLLPEEFFLNPTAWLESRDPLEQDAFLRSEDIGDSPVTIKKVVDSYQDFTPAYTFDSKRLRKIILGSGPDRRVVISKRLNPKQKDFKEAEVARKAFLAGIPTPEVLGQVEDHGNLYVFYEYIPSHNLQWLDDHFKKVFGLNLFSEFSTAIPNKHNIKKAEGFFSRLFVEALESILESVEYLDRELSRADWAMILSREELEMKRCMMLKKLATTFTQAYLGYNIDDEVNRLCTLIYERGFKNDDLVDRNIILSWDEDHNRPAKGEDGKAKLYVIDWEYSELV